MVIVLSGDFGTMVILGVRRFVITAMLMIGMAQNKLPVAIFLR